MSNNEKGSYTGARRASPLSGTMSKDEFKKTVDTAFPNMDAHLRKASEQVLVEGYAVKHAAERVGCERSLASRTVHKIHKTFLDQFLCPKGWVTERICVPKKYMNRIKEIVREAQEEYTRKANV